MITITRLFIPKNEGDVDRLIRLAANNNVHAVYKIGVYGKERQNELYLTGRPWDVYEFMSKHKNERQ